MSTTPRQGPVWSKRVGDSNVADANVRFCAGYDVRGKQPADSRLAPHDLHTNAAHLLMLVRQSIVTTEAGSAAAGALLRLRERLDGGEDLLRPECEDIHMSIESLVTEIAGADAGGRLHTARSRNDQVATDMRLWLREEIADTTAAIGILSERLAAHARVHVETVCPGFTHGQPAMVTSWGHWTMSYLPRLLRDVRALAVLLRDLSTCPLGAAASFGTSWPIDRPGVAKSLGFRHPAPSGADAIWSRGEIEGRYAFVVSQFLSHLAGIAQDIILLSSPPRDWLRLADEHVTGSSIMPQKRNPDFAEVTRARASHAFGIAQSLLGIGSGLMSGYNRDTQWTKYLVFDAADNVDAAAELYGDVFDRMAVNKAAMRAACDIGFLNATDVADHLSRTRAIPFRACYRIIGAAVKESESAGKLLRDPLNRELEAQSLAPLSEAEWATLENPEGLLMARDQDGNPHPDRTRASIDLLSREIAEEVQAVSARRAEWNAALEKTWEELRQLAG